MADAWEISGGEGDVHLRSGLAELHYHAQHRLPYFHPVRTPAGRLVSLAVPQDHPWHVGLYFAWRFVNGVNCWEPGVGGAAAGPVRVESDPGGTVVLRQGLLWGAAGAEPLREERQVVVHPPAPAGDGYLLDWTGVFLADGPVTLACTPPPSEVSWGGYAGLSLRLPRSFYNARVRDAAGRESAERVHGQPGAWCDCTGKADGEPDGVCGAALIEHPSNPRHPSPSFALTAGTLQFIQRAFLWSGPLLLGAGDSFCLRYRVWLHDGEPDPAEVAAEAARFAAVP